MQKHTEDILNLTANQLEIFKCIFNRPRTKEEIAIVLGLAVKTISNNLPLMVNTMQHHDIIRYIDADDIIYFAIKPHKIWMPDLLPKIYSYDRSPIHPYMVINLPDPPNGAYWDLHPLGDWHYGASECDYQAVDNVIKSIKNNDSAIVLFTGDLMENANKESIGDGVYRQLIPPQKQQEEVIYKSAPIAHKIIAAVGGNHGNRTVKSVYLDPDKNIADSLEIEHFDGMLYIDIICQNHKWEVLAMHGVTGATTLAGRLNAIKKKNTFHTADIFLMAHTHDQQIPWDIEVKRDPVAMKLVERDRAYVLTGGFLKPHIGYANKKEFPPLPVGMPHIHLKCNGSNDPGSYEVHAGRTHLTCKSEIYTGGDDA